MNCNLVHNGDSILVHVRGEKSYMARVLAGKCVDIYQRRIPSNKLIGLVYNGWYILRDEKLGPVIESAADPTVQNYTALTAGGDGDALDGFCDDGAEEVRQALLASEAYKNKETEFAKQKVVNRAQKRHMFLFMIELANPYNLCKYIYTGRMPNNNLFMSHGNYAFLIQHSDAARLPGFSRVLIYDDLDGRIAAGVASRMVLADSVIDKTHLYAKDLSEECNTLISRIQECTSFEERHRHGFTFLQNARKRLRLPNYDQEVVAVTGRTLGLSLKNSLIDCNIFPCKHGLESARPNISPFVCTINATKLTSIDSLQLMGYEIAAAQDERTSDEVPDEETAAGAQVWTPESLTRAIMCDYDMWLERKLCLLGISIDKLREAIYALAPREKQSRLLRPPLCIPLDSTHSPLVFDSLIVVAKSRPLPLVQLLSRFVRPSAPVAVYSICPGAIVELGNTLVKTRSGHMLSYMDNRTLEYQILPGRTRPAMIGESLGGYILTYYTQPLTEDDESIFRRSRNAMLQKKKALKQ